MTVRNPYGAGQPVGKDVIGMVDNVPATQLAGCALRIRWAARHACARLRAKLAASQVCEKLRPPIEWTPNADAGDHSGHCSACGQVRDDPHTLSDCLVVVSSERDAALDGVQWSEFPTVLA